MKNILPFALLLLLLSRCGEVYIPDPVELRIAKYSEEGNQVAGAIVNGDSWKTIFGYSAFGGDVPMNIFSSPDLDSLIVTFSGSMQDGVNQGKLLDLQFILRGQSVERFLDLLRLNGQKFVINNTDVLANIGNLDPYLEDAPPLSACNQGQILFRTIKYAEPAREGVSPELIVAGTFGLECDQNGVTTTIYTGRFDFLVNGGDIFFPGDTMYHSSTSINPISSASPR